MRGPSGILPNALKWCYCLDFPQKTNAFCGINLCYAPSAQKISVHFSGLVIAFKHLAQSTKT